MKEKVKKDIEEEYNLFKIIISLSLSLYKIYKNLFICVIYCLMVLLLFCLELVSKLSSRNLNSKNLGTSFGSRVGKNIKNWVTIRAYFFIVFGLTCPIACL